MARQKAIVLPTADGDATYWTVPYLKELIRNDREAAMRALRRVYLNQTASETREGSATTTNGIGFNRSDAPQLTSIAKKLDRYGELSSHDLNILHELMPKYAKQVFNYMCSRYPDKIVILKY